MSLYKYPMSLYKRAVFQLDPEAFQELKLVVLEEGRPPTLRSCLLEEYLHWPDGSITTRSGDRTVGTRESGHRVGPFPPTQGSGDPSHRRQTRS